MPRFKFSSLDNVSIEEITKTFNDAFSDYFIPFRLTSDQMAFKFFHEGVDLSISVGAFIDGQLVGFIYHATGQFKGRKCFYNAGTGVVPDHRGNSLTSKMYDYVLPKLKEAGFEAGVLEVITDNVGAIKNYERVGFRKTRTVHILKGRPEAEGGEYRIKEVEDWNWESFRSWWSWEPTWQNQPMCIDRMRDGVRCLVIESKEDPVAYVIVNREGNRIRQWAVHPDHRNKGMATALFSKVSSEGGEIDLGNIDLDATATSNFLHSLGLSSPLQQFEMEMIF